jgi:hypothetical protein
MTQYIEEEVFRSCITSDRENYPYFTKDGNNVKLKDDVTKDFKTSNPLNFLMINDTFHDLVNPRGTYNPKGFIEGPLNYLLTGDTSITTDNVKTYENGINFPEYQELSGRFEPKVAKAFEINMGLQTADTFITYDDILRYVTIDSANQIIINNPEFLKKVIDANGSIAISLNSDESSTFSTYIEKKNMNNAERNDAYLKISYFIRWYLHSTHVERTNTYDITDTSMKILFDAGSSFLKEFFSAPDSKVEPFVAIPCILDSASTSTEKLDPNLDFFFEEVTLGHVVPIVSNYFSCDKYFFCYLPNTNDQYNLDTLYGFSLAIIKVTPENREVIQSIRNKVAKFNSDEYFAACQTVYEYINTNTNKNVARYFFGQVKKDKSYNSSCGTCGAGVPYIGRVISKIKNLQSIEFPVTGPWLSQDQQSNLNILKNELDSLKDNTNEPLGGRIPFSDARILKIFCDLNENITMTEEDLLSLFQILADYKRTGDYQQAYTVLKAILKSGGNSEFFTFCSGDELSALIGRLLGVPSIYQTANGAQCRLYRGRLFSTDDNAKRLYKLKNDIKIINKYCDAINTRIGFLKKFISNNYDRNLVLRDKLRVFIESLKTEYDAANTSANTAFASNNKVAVKANNLAKENRINAFFKLISVRNAFNKLNEIISLSSLLSTDFFPNVIGSGESIISKIISHCKNIKAIQGDDIIISKENDIVDALEAVSDFEATLNGFKIYNFIEDNFPQYFNKIDDNPQLISINGSYDEDISIIDLSNTDTNKNLKIPALDLNFVFSKVRSVSSLFSTYSSINETETQIKSNSGRRRQDVLNDKLRLLKIEFLNGYNEFIDSCKFLQDNGNTFKIQDVYKFDEIMSTKNDVLARILPEEVSAPVAIDTIDGTLLAAEVLIELARGQQPGEQQPRGGSNEETKYIQQGGAIYDENKRIILNDVKKLLLNLYNKCTNYIKNVQNDPSIAEFAINLGVPANFLAFLNTISATYETEQFCYQLLFQEADVEEENTIDNINIGFLTGLKLITDQYTYADLGYTQLRQGSEDIIKENISINFLLNPNPLINLSDIKTLLFLLGCSSTDYLELISTYFDEPVEKYDTKKDVEIDDREETLPLVSSYPENLLQPLQPSQPIPDSIKSIFSIVFCSILEYLYYGRENGKIYKFNSEYIDSIISLSLAGNVTSLSRSYALNVDSKINEPSDSYLTSTLKNYINAIPDVMLEKLGYQTLNIHSKRKATQRTLPNVTSESQKGPTYVAKGVNKMGGKQRKTIKKSKTNTNSKTRKMKKTKKQKFTKRMKKSNRNNKRSRK